MVVSQNPVSCAELLSRFPDLFREVLGDGARQFTRVASPEAATAESAVFLANPKALTSGLQSPAMVIVVGPKSRAELEAKRGERTVLIATNVELAMAKTINTFFLPSPYTNRAVTGVHPTAVIGAGAELAPDVRVGPHAVLGRGVKVGAGAYIGANTVIEDEVEIGAGTVIHPLVYIGHSTLIGKNCEIHPSTVVGKEGFGYAHDERFNHHKIPHQGRVVIEDGVHLGAHVAIDRGTFGETRIQAGAILDNQIHIAHNCGIGRNSVLTSGFAMAGSSSIGANFVAGGKSVVTGHVKVGDNVQIAAMSGIAKDLMEPGQYGGIPLVPLQQHIKIKAAIVQLPEMRKQLAKLIKKFGLDAAESETSAN